jgi:CelD/BcsL family acetyltransferase involved in cellulose biosynthesis
MAEFFRLARVVSAKTYQEKLLDAGLPDSSDFYRTAEALAAEGGIRSFILFDGDRPVSYLYCPVKDNALIYEYLGYDPEYAKLSVGTVLQWLALRYLFDEALFHIFDFTEGESDHKRLFATHNVQCANVYFIRASLRNRALLLSQIAVDSLSKQVGRLLDQYGVKAQIKKLIRFGT